MKEIEQALQDSEESRRLALDLTHLGFWDWDVLNNTLVWNDNHFLLLGLEAFSVEPSYELWRSRLHPDDLTWVERRFRESLENHTSYTAEYRVIYPDNSVHWLMAKAKAIYDEAGQPVRSLGVLIDVTDRKLIELILQQETRQKQLLWKVTQNIRQSLDLETILTTTVEEVRQVLQGDRVAIYRFWPDWGGDFVTESVGETWVKLVHPDQSKVWEDTYLQATQGGRFQRQETFVVANIYQSGLEQCHINLLEQFQAKAYVVAPIFFSETLWGLLAIYQNGTPRDWQTGEIELLEKIANQLAIAIQQSKLYNQLQTELQERKQREAILREAERRWRSLLDNVQLMVIELDLSGNINYVNPFFLNLTGYNQSEVLGKNWFANFLPASHQVLLQQTFAEVLSDRAHPYYQNAILTKSGEERFIAWNNTVLQDSQENIIGVISIGEDITQRKKIGN